MGWSPAGLQKSLQMVLLALFPSYWHFDGCLLVHMLLNLVMSLFTETQMGLRKNERKRL